MQPSSTPNPGEVSAQRRACDVGVIFALSFESGPFEDRLANRVKFTTPGATISEGWLQKGKIAVVNSGAGQSAAADAAEAIIAGHRPRWLISAGFAGGLQPDLRRNDLVLADHVASAVEAISNTASQNVLPITIPAQLNDLLNRPSVHRGKIITADKIVNRAADKRRLGQQYQALAVDMETLAIAQVCQRLGQPLFSIRVISDAMDDELPADLDRLMTRRTNAQRFGAAIGTLFHRPSSIKDLWRLHEAAIEASSRLAKFLVEVIERLE